MSESLTQLGWRRGDDPEKLILREWLVTNGLGGYASGTIAGVATRRYHGFLIAALPVPLGRIVMLNHLDERCVGANGEALLLGGDEPSHVSDPMLPDLEAFDEFRLEWGLPIWTYRTGSAVIEKRIVMPYWQNTTYIAYRVVSGVGPVELHIRPSVSFRPHEMLVSEPVNGYRIEEVSGRWEIRAASDIPPLRLRFVAPQGAELVPEDGPHSQRRYRVERSRGYEHEGPLWTPGYFRIVLNVGEQATLVASSHSWEAMEAIEPEDAWRLELERRSAILTHAAIAPESNFEAQLVLAADQFVITPQSRRADQARMQALGDEPRTIIAGYHWFTDWGRDTMISLEGLTLVTKRYREAGRILRTFGSYVRDGLIPNMFPEGEHEGLYHTADATMWFFHAVHRYVETTGDRETLRHLLPVLVSIIDHHLSGTRFGIGVDPADGLLRQGADGYQLTWMDAKVGDWVVTPRRGKAVEINALYYNALRLLERWLVDAGEKDRAREFGAIADHVRDAFNERFWYEEGQYLFDIVDAEGGGNDKAIRPNQIFALSLDHPVLDKSRWQPVLETVRRELLTPVGLRSLSRDHPDYKERYYGDLRARDAAYHQGTVWGWLIGPYIDAWLKVHPRDRKRVPEMLEGFRQHLGDGCIGTISEVFDAEEPFTERGCVAQAWSIAEVLRCLEQAK
jgi:predicted glycogen debranching enzyme